MTYWELAQTMDAETFVRWFKQKQDYGCRQGQTKTIEDRDRVWRDLCRIKYNGEDGCYRCCIDWFNSEIKEQE